MNEQERKEWLAERRKGVGASEAAAIVGCSDWDTALGVYLDKLELRPERPIESWQKLGLWLEPHIAEEYTQQTGIEVEKGPPQMVAEGAPWMRASLDYLSPDRVVQIKSVQPFPNSEKKWGDPEKGELPKEIYLQVQQEMEVAQRDRADVATWFLGRAELLIFAVTRNDAVIKNLHEAEAEFMQRVENREPPLPDFEHRTTLDLLASIEPEIGRSITLDATYKDLVNRYLRLASLNGRVEKAKKEAQAKLIAAMGKCETAHITGFATLTRKAVHRKGYTVQPSTYFRFNAKKGSDK